MSTRKSIQKLNTTESPTKTTITMSAASSLQATPKTQQTEIDSKISTATDTAVASDDETTTTTTTISTPTESTTTTTTIPTITTTTTVITTPKIVSTAENDLIIKTSDSDTLDTTTNSSSVKEQQELSPTNSTDLTTTTTTEIKRGRRKNSVASSLTSSPTCSQQSNNKKSSIGSDDNNEEIVGDGGANENVNDLTQNSVIEQKLSDETKSESPVRVGRKKKVFNKTAIITRKSAATTPTSKPTIINQQIRTSMRNRRNSTGKIDLKQNEPMKKNVKQTRKTLSATPEPRTPIKRKREDSSKSDDKDEQQPNDKIVKIETDDEHQQQQQEQMDINDELDEDEKTDENTNEKSPTINIKKEIANDEKDSINDSDKNVEDESDIKPNDDTNNDSSKTLTFPRRRGRPKLQKNDKTVANIRRRRSDKIPIDTSLELPEIKRPKRRGRKPDGKDDNNSILDDTIKTDLETTVDDADDDSEKLTTATTTNNNNSKNLNGLAKPLTVDTTNVTALPSEIEKTKLLDTIKNEIATTSSDKAASLSPELISEGVSVISVKQFYKKPEFLENNLGIEKDPKLGEIVQEVEKNTTSPTNISLKNNNKINKKNIDEIDNNKNNNESNNNIDEINSLAEGELHFDEDSIADESNNKLDTKEINQNDDDIKNEDNIKDSNKENKSTDMLKLNLCDNINKNHNNNNNDKMDDDDDDDENSSTAVQIESINKNIIDNNIKDKIQSECNNKKNTAEIKIEKDLIKIDNCKDDKKKTPKINENLKVTPINKSLDNAENQLKQNEVNAESNINKTIIEKSKNENVSVDQIEISKNVEDDNKMDVANDVNLTNKENCTKNIEEDIIMKEEENIEKSKDKSEEVKFKLESKPKESDEKVISNHSKSETIDEDSSKNSGEQSKKMLSASNKRLLETPETMRQKEKHLKNLGLLTHKAAVQAKIDKQRRRKLLQTTVSTNKKQITEPSTSTNITSTVVVANSSSNNGGNLNKIQDSDSTSNTSTVYSIKSGENKRKSTSGSGSNNNNSGRQSLKITFQKGRGRGIQNERTGSQTNQSCEDTYYTIQSENEVGQPEEAVSHGRKSLNRNHTIDTTVTNQLDATADSQNKKDGKEKILIPEKASSFSIHPGRLCQDQCYYCGGRFGLYDTPCHVAQLKSVERQQKILANEEKLLVDNCLCDACFRHVDKRANVPSYKKRLSALNSVDNENLGNNSQQNDNENNDEHQQSFGNKSICFVPGCNNSAAHSLRKKCIRKTIKKILPNFDLSTIGGITPICSQHYDSILQYLGCALCKRRLGKNHMYHIQESEKLEVLLSENNVPVQIGNSSAICKLCRYFTNLLMKPSTGTKQNDFVRSYRRRLLQFHNVQTDDDASDECDGMDSEKSKSKRNRKSKREETITTTILDEKTSESTNSPPSLIIDENPSDLSNSGLSTTAAAATSGQMMLDNDVLVDYDVPIISSESPTPSPPPLLASKLKSILQSNNNINNNNTNDKNKDISLNNNKKEDISLVLRSNPNISMRELFPGEEEMGLHVNLPFGSSSSHRTPEGWTRVQTFLQYDEPTRRLWEDLQKPYGNQSSFLRHLILLEKYYRNGDLTLSHNASSNATVYSETVQNRLCSYDNNNLINNNNNNNNNHIASNSTITVTPIINNTSGSQQQQSGGNRKNLNNKNERSRSQSMESVKQINNNNNNNSNYPITITTRPKQQNTQSSTSTSINNNNNTNQSSTSNNNSSNDLIKSNLLVGNKNAIEILPILSTSSSSTTTTIKSTNDNNSIGSSNSMTKQQKLLAAANKLIGNETAIDLKTTTNINKNTINEQKKNDNINLSMPPELISINRQASSNMLMNNKQQQQQQQQLQLQQQHQRIQNFQLQQQQLPQHHHNKHHISTSKHGIIVLPETLSPMEQINIKNWRPTLMPITSGAHLNQSGPLYKTVDGRKLPGVVQVQSRGRPYLISIHDYNRMCILRREKLLYDQMVKNGKIKHGMRPPAVLSPKILSSHQQQQQQQNKLKIPSKVLEQNSLIPVGGGNQRSATATNSLQQMSQEQSRQQQIKHRLHLQQQQQQQQISLLKSSTAGGNYVPILPKLPQNHQLQILPTSGNHTPMSIATSLINNSVSIVPTISGVLSLAQGGTLSGSNMATLTPSTLTGLNSVRNIMTAQKPRLDQLINNNKKNLYGSTSTATSSSVILDIDNSLFSKIPKSLTVIPQQKLQSQQQGRTSSEDLTSA